MKSISLEAVFLAFLAFSLSSAYAVGRHPPNVLLASSSSINVKEIPSVGLGTWLSDRDKVSGAVEYALKGGYRHVDAALIYKNEDKTGQGIACSHIPREDVWVTSKLWNAHHRPQEATAAIRKSIADLGVGYLDLYLMHWPVAFVPDTKGNKLDKTVTIVDTWRAMENLARANLTRYIGISNFARHEVETILGICVICPYAHEFEAHPYLQQQEFVDWHLEKGIKVIAYSPFGNTNPIYHGKHDNEDKKTERKERKKKTLLQDPFWVKLADKKNVTVAQAVLGWGLQRGTVVIPKSTDRKHIDENLAARSVEFSEEEMKSIRGRDRKTRMNNPGKEWGVRLFSDLDDPTKLDRDGDDDLAEGLIGGGDL